MPPCLNGDWKVNTSLRKIMTSARIEQLAKRVAFALLNNFKHAPQTVLINSIPKAGTHLLSSMLSELPNLTISSDLTQLDKVKDDDMRLNMLKSRVDLQNKGIWLGHIPYSESIDGYLGSLNIPIIFIYRDPRDIVVSLLHYVRKNDNHIYNKIIGESDSSAALNTLVNGYGKGVEEYELSDSSIPALSHFVNAYSPWIWSKNCFAVSYEGLVGSEQSKNIHAICNYLNLNHSVKRLLVKGIGSKESSTLREGKIKAWSSELSSDILNEISNQEWSDSSLKTFFHG